MKTPQHTHTHTDPHTASHMRVIMHHYRDFTLWQTAKKPLLPTHERNSNECWRKRNVQPMQSSPPCHTVLSVKTQSCSPLFSPALLLAASESFPYFLFVLNFISFTVFFSSPALISCIQIHTSQLLYLPSEVQREFFFIRSGFISHPFSLYLPWFRWIHKLVFARWRSVS